MSLPCAYQASYRGSALWRIPVGAVTTSYIFCNSICAGRITNLCAITYTAVKAGAGRPFNLIYSAHRDTNPRRKSRGGRGKKGKLNAPHGIQSMFVASCAAKLYVQSTGESFSAKFCVTGPMRRITGRNSKLPAGSYIIANTTLPPATWVPRKEVTLKHYEFPKESPVLVPYTDNKDVAAHSISVCSKLPLCLTFTRHGVIAYTTAPSSK